MDARNIILIFDASASMSGTGLEALRQAVQLMLSALRDYTGRSRKLTIILYESTPYVLYPTEIIHNFEDFELTVSLPLSTLEPAGASNFGAALRLIPSFLSEREVSLVYWFTDGEPTDDWERVLESLRGRIRLIGVGCGMKVNVALLSEVCDRVFGMENLTTEALLGTLRSG
ncbi:MAG: VWA domain-containing protein [Anaerolineae bacterium]